MRTIRGTDELVALQGEELGVSDWHTVTQDLIDRFADLTGDRQWIHVDVERAGAGRFGTTVAHGYLTLSLLPLLADEVYRVDGFGTVVNYGLNRLRFPSPVHAGARVRAGIRVLQVEALDGGAQAEFRATIAVEGADKPAAVADYLNRYYA